MSDLEEDLWCLDPSDVISVHHPRGWLSASIRSPFLVFGLLSPLESSSKSPSGFVDFPGKRNPDSQDRAGVKRHLENTSGSSETQIECIASKESLSLFEFWQ